MLTDEEKRIYNNHLVASRKSQNLPFQIRRNFDNLDQEKITLLQRLRKFFENYPHIRQEDFFMAPFKIWSDQKHYGLDFFVSGKARKAYTQYIKSIQVEDPDSDDALRRLIEGFKFLFKFCSEKSLTIEDYPLYVEETLPCMVSHLKDHHINFYLLHAIGVSRLNIDTKILDFVFGWDFYPVFQKTKSKFYSSKKMKKLSKQALTKITEKLN